MQYPSFTESHKSLMAKFLTKEMFEELKDLKTSNGFTIHDAINSGVENPDSGIGAYAGDRESYTLFAPFFDKIIEEYHGFSQSDMHKSNLNTDDLSAPNPDPENKFIISTRIRVGRNLENFPLGPAISNKQRDEVENTVSTALNSLQGDLSGKYYPIAGMSEEDSASLIADHFLFKAGDRFLESAGLNRNWPHGRGIYHNNDKTFLVWINEEDELRIISMQRGGDIKQVFSRLTTAIYELEKKMKFAFSEHLGYITSCPTNLGTAMRASVHIKVPKLATDMDRFKEITDRHHLQIRGIHGEHSESEGGVYDISNRRRLGVTEVECVQDMYDGVVELIAAEKELALLDEVHDRR
ncbi:MAG: phosphagen kinase [Campylobacterota bacterium]